MADDDTEWDWGFIAFCFAVIVTPFIVAGLLVWGLVSYGQRWEACDNQHGDFQFFSAKCLEDSDG